MRYRYKPFTLVAAVPAIVGCHSRSEVPERLRLDGFRFSAQSGLVGATGDSLRVEVVVRNLSPTYRTIVVSSCTPTVAVSVYRANKKWDSDAWEQSKLPVYHDSVGRIIPMNSMCSIISSGNMPPGIATEFLREIPVGEILGDSLPSGRYKVKAHLRINSQAVEDLSAGELELRVPPT
jgi:hypothetical protein